MTDIKKMAEDMASALEQSIMRMDHINYQREEATLANIWLPQCDAAIVHAKVALEAWRNYVKKQ